VSEVAFFSTLIVTYLAYLGEDTVPPTPATALSLGTLLSPGLVIWTTACLLSSSLTIHLAEGALRRGRTAAFRGLWALTIALGAIFLVGTAYEWRGLIEEHGLTISTNLFGTTYYTLVGFHGLHVTIGLVALTVVLGLALRGPADGGARRRRRDGVVVLALCGRRLGGGVHDRLRARPVVRQGTHHRGTEHTEKTKAEKGKKES
jgi:heme/copper-type cytochrome/quinol oxidase subunit 3